MTEVTARIIKDLIETRQISLDDLPPSAVVELQDQDLG